MFENPNHCLNENLDFLTLDLKQVKMIGQIMIKYLREYDFLDFTNVGYTKVSLIILKVDVIIIRRNLCF